LSRNLQAVRYGLGKERDRDAETQEALTTNP